MSHRTIRRLKPPTPAPLIISFLLTSFLLITSACSTDVDQSTPEASSNELKLGLLAPKSGPLAGFGQAMEQSARLAVSEINAAGGVNGQKIALLVRDTRLGLPNFLTTSQEVTKELINKQVVAIIGPAGSGTTLSIAPQLIDAQIPLISPSATSPEISLLSDQDMIWRTTASDAFQGVFLAKQMRDSGINTMSIIYRDDAYGRGLNQSITNHFLGLGGSVMASQSYPADQTEGFGQVIDSLFDQGIPDALVIVSFAIDGSNIAIGLANQNRAPLPKLYGVDGNFLQSFLDNSPAGIIVGMRGSAPVAPENLSTWLAFKNRFESTFNTDISPFTENVYDAIYLSALSFVYANENSSMAIVNNLRNISRPDSMSPLKIPAGPEGFALAKESPAADWDYLGAGGEIDFDENGDVTSGNYILWEVVNNNDQLAFKIVLETSFPSIKKPHQ